MLMHSGAQETSRQAPILQHRHAKGYFTIRNSASGPVRLTDRRGSCGAEVPKDMDREDSGVPSKASGLRAGEALCELGSWVAADVKIAKGVPESLREGVPFCCCCCWPGRLMLR